MLYVGCSLFTNCSYDSSKRKSNYSKDIGCMKNFWLCEKLKEYATVIIMKRGSAIINKRREKTRSKHFPCLKKNLAMMIKML